MSDANFASLSSTLLARKGGAKPAMRPQSGILGPVDGKEAAASLEDLGWNDMGESEQAPVDPAEEKVVAITSRAANEAGAPNQVRESLTKIQAQLERPAQPRPIVRKAAAAQGKRSLYAAARPGTPSHAASRLHRPRSQRTAAGDRRA